MALNSNSQNTVNPQLLQQRLNVREQEINSLKVQNRHLLGRIEELEKEAEPNQIDTQFVADEVRRHLDPVVQQLTSTMTSSFEILQSTMRGIYQQSQRSQKAVEDTVAHSRELEIRLNDQRKQDQNFYQDKIFAMIGNFCDRLERQLDIRLKSLAGIEIVSAKQNEMLMDLETLNIGFAAIQKNSETNRAEISRMEKNSNEIHQNMVEVQVQSQNTEELIRDTLQQIQNHRAEFKLIRAELKQAADSMNSLLERIEETQNPTPHQQSASVTDETMIQNLITQKQDELEELEKNIVKSQPKHPAEDATLILSLLRSQKNELQKAADEAKNYLAGQLNLRTGEPDDHSGSPQHSPEEGR